MQIRLYLDEDAMSRSLARELRARGIDVTTTISEGMLGQDDVLQLEFAKVQGRVIYTYNVADYYRLHTEYITQGRAHSGIILAHQRRYGIGEQIRRTLKLMAALPAEEMHNRAEYLSAWG
jgi:uncharacterized protein with PIN domain